MSVSIADDGVDELHVNALRGERDRLLAFAFCSANFLVELDTSLNVNFVRGATTAITGCSSKNLARIRSPESLTGIRWDSSHGAPACRRHVR